MNGDVITLCNASRLVSPIFDNVRVRIGIGFISYKSMKPLILAVEGPLSKACCSTLLENYYNRSEPGILQSRSSMQVRCGIMSRSFVIIRSVRVILLKLISFKPFYLACQKSKRRCSSDIAAFSSSNRFKLSESTKSDKALLIH